MLNKRKRDWGLGIRDWGSGRANAHIVELCFNPSQIWEQFPSTQETFPVRLAPQHSALSTLLQHHQTTLSL
ncbi:hypothetical protein I8752_07805 [Nostocaceae cyanobacterium CENA369]|uniref:Uncharacterized protein n=1 Tax=Dendronalium phyllosphericum CENA369 TaxID=1725256 RepID=A0A8J7I602_9NOST|nr:hypothetical protein [Dendronalium phyllosphericum]MBH8572922.1 hypothetical protein [Dendronalium phyllosphericum CENA369]